MNVAGLVVAGGEGVGWIVRTESKGLSKAVGGHGVLEVGVGRKWRRRGGVSK